MLVHMVVFTSMHYTIFYINTPARAFLGKTFAYCSCTKSPASHNTVKNTIRDFSSYDNDTPCILYVPNRHWMVPFKFEVRRYDLTNLYT